MRFINLTRRTEIGANSYLVEIAGRKIVLDAGLHPRQLAEEALPNYRHIPDESVSSIFISHAHQDHIGSLPVLMRRQPQARVFMTEATARLSEVMLHNSINVMTRQREDLGLATYPLFTHRETEQAAMVWHKAQVGQRWSMEGERVPDDENENNFEFFEAGHILGADQSQAARIHQAHLYSLFRKGHPRINIRGIIVEIHQNIVPSPKLEAAGDETQR